MLKNKKKGFTLVELIVVIAIMVVLLAVLAPSLLRYVENSRMQRDDSAMDEVCNSVQLAMADSETFDEVFSYSIPNNYTTYTDSSGVYGARYTDEEYWAPDGGKRTVTITFNPNENGDYVLADANINDMTSGNGSLGEPRTTDASKICKFENMGNQKLYSAVKKVVDNTIFEESATYRNSSYTIFIIFELTNGLYRAEVDGSYNGTNLSPDSPSAPKAPLPDNTPEVPAPSQPTQPQNPVIPPEDLGGGGSITFPDDPEPSKPDDTETYVEYAFKAKDYDKKMGTTTATDSVVVIPETFEYNGITYKVTSLGEEAFYNCDNLTNVTIPNGVISIEKSAFSSCNILSNVTIPDSVTNIGSLAFSYCRNLTSIEIPNSVIDIKNSTFSNSGLTSIAIPNGVTSIGDYAFDGCASLQSITLPNTLISIGNRVFRNCTSLESITLPDSITSIGYEAFYYCTNLVSVNIPNSLTTLSKKLFSYCKKLPNITIPDSVTTIGDYAFCNCESLTSIVIPNGVTSIGEIAFQGCNTLTSIAIPHGVSTISYRMLACCENLRSITLPVTITSIGRDACFSSDKLTTINYAGTEEQWNAISFTSGWDDMNGVVSSKPNNYTINYNYVGS